MLVVAGLSGSLAGCSFVQGVSSCISALCILFFGFSYVGLIFFLYICLPGVQVFGASRSFCAGFVC